MTVQAMETADAELGVTETKDLTQQDQQIESLKGRVASLRQDIEQRIRNAELNLQQLKNLQSKIPELRSQYDGKLDRGDAGGAEKILQQIKKAYDDLQNAARNTLSSESENKDLQEQETELARQVNQLTILVGENFRIAEKQRDNALSLSGTMSNGMVKPFMELDKVTQDNHKLAEQILAAE